MVNKIVVGILVMVLECWTTGSITWMMRLSNRIISRTVVGLRAPYLHYDFQLEI